MLDGKTQARNHLPDQPWDPMIDYQMMSRFVHGFASLMRADKPTVVKIHGYCVAGGTDIAPHADQIVVAADAKIGYPQHGFRDAVRHRDEPFGDAGRRTSGV